MKRLLKVSLAVLALTVMCSTAGFAQKFGYINSSELIESMPEMDTVRQKFEKYQQDIQDNYEAMQVELNNKYEDYIKNNSTMTDAIRQIREDEMQQIQQRIAQFEQSAPQQMSDEQRRLMAPLWQKAQEVTQRVAKANGFTMVFEISSAPLAYYDESTLTDILPMVQADMGIR